MRLHRYELATLIDNAIYSCKPAEKSALVVDERPLLQRYVVSLLHTQLDKYSIEKVAKQLRKLPWSDAAQPVERWAQRYRRNQHGKSSILALSHPDCASNPITGGLRRRFSIVQPSSIMRSV